MGSFRLAAGRLHHHKHFNFAESREETVWPSLRHSCRSELTRQGISLTFVALKPGSTCSTRFEGPDISAGLCMSPCRSDSIFTLTSAWLVVSEDSWRGAPGLS